MNEIVPFAITEAHGEFAERIVRSRWYNRWQRDPLLLQPGFAHHGAGYPTRIRCLLDDGGGHLGCLATDVADPDG